MIAWLRRWLQAAEDQAFSWFQARCRHPGHMVRADILEGAGRGADTRGGFGVGWCLRCGAYRHKRYACDGVLQSDPAAWEWRHPRADWTGDL